LRGPLAQQDETGQERVNRQREGASASPRRQPAQCKKMRAASERLMSTVFKHSQTRSYGALVDIS